MENRVLFELLKEMGNADSPSMHTVLLNSINNSAEILSQDIKNALESKSHISIQRAFAGFQSLDKLISFDFKVNESDNVFINIDSCKLSYGFTLQLLDEREAIDFEEFSKGARSRYFSSIIQTKLCNGRTEISSEFELTIRQLNSRDFMDYTIFVLTKATEVIGAQRSRNKISMSNASY